MSDPFITYQDVSKHYGDVVAVDDISFEIEQGELVALLGPSGSGKTTTLRMLAGFETVTAGEVYLDGENVTGIPPHKRDTGMVFQDYALFPHMTVAENVGFGLERRGFDDSAIDDRVEEVLELVDLDGFGDRRPENLSGGQQQRVASARAIAIEPKVLLMDEPLGALDKKLRDQLQIELRELQRDLGITTLYVTHNQGEALTMADRVAVMNEGRIEQLATPTEIYEEPANEFVADFIGDTNFLPGDLSDGEDGVRLAIEDASVSVNATSLPDDQQVAFVRPEKITVTDDPDPGLENAVAGRVEKVVFLGSKIRYYVDIAGNEVVAEETNVDRANTFDRGDAVYLNWARQDTQLARA